MYYILLVHVQEINLVTYCLENATYCHLWHAIATQIKNILLTQFKGRNIAFRFRMQLMMDI